MPRLKFALQVVVAVALLLAAAWATGVVKVNVESDPTPTVHRAPK
jgi:hypothetical protein